MTGPQRCVPLKPLPSGAPSLNGVAGMKTGTVCVICAKRDSSSGAVGTQRGSWTRLGVGSSPRKPPVGLVLKMEKEKGKQKGPFRQRAALGQRHRRREIA